MAQRLSYCPLAVTSVSQEEDDGDSVSIRFPLCNARTTEPSLCFKFKLKSFCLRDESPGQRARKEVGEESAAVSPRPWR
jgi:hypothetical protein